MPRTTSHSVWPSATVPPMAAGAVADALASAGPGDGFLTRDSRVVEHKKYGKAKARRSFQFSKR